MKKYPTQQHTGFTLLEMLVAIAIFSIVALMAVGASVRLFSAYGQTQVLQSAIDNLNFTLESMSRDVRFGDSYTVISGDNPSIEVVFSKSGSRCENESERIIYKKEGARILRTSICPSGTEESFLTSEKINISNFYISVDQTDQPWTVIAIKGNITRGKQSTEFTIQTSVSKRGNNTI